jgi:S-formylglutathione hydrolase FrmB
MALIQCEFTSQVLGLACSMNVILPNPLAATAAEKFPVLYLLHGLSDNHTAWCRFTSIERYVSNLNLAVVMPAVNRSFYSDMASGPRYWTFISEEIPAVARHLFPLSAERKDNYVAGLSMGGYGAFKLALAHPDRYAAAASLSGALDIVQWLQDEAKQGGTEMRGIFGSVEKAAGGVDDLFAIAKTAVAKPSPLPALFQWCGTGDFLYEANIRFRDHTRKIGLPVEYSESEGGHDWLRWDEQIQRVLAWLPGVAKR